MRPTSSPRDLLVVGGGVLGWAVAARLAERGHGVTLATDAVDGRSAASAASLAWVSGHGKTPAWYALLNAEGHARHAALSAARPPEQRWFHRVGALRGGDVVAEDGYVDDIAFVAAQRADLLARGGRMLLGTRVLGLSRDSGGIVAETANDALRADAVVLAAGTGTAALLRSAGVQTGRLGTGAGPSGFLARLRAPALPPITRLTDDDGLRIRPDGGDTVAVQWQALEDAAASGGEPLTAQAIWPRLRARLSAHLGCEVAEDALISVHVAVRPLPDDGLPVVGAVAPGIHVLVTHSGMTLAPLLAELAARDIDGDEDPRLHPLRPHPAQPASASTESGKGTTR